MVAILVAVGMFRASGAMDIMVRWLSIMTGKIGMPAEALPMALMRPLSGSGAYGILASIINDPSIGPDSYVGYLVSTLQGSTETTFYVLAVYFGAIQVRRPAIPWHPPSQPTWRVLSQRWPFAPISMDHKDQVHYTGRAFLSYAFRKVLSRQSFCNGGRRPCIR
jgi:hypothetical protein